MFFLSEEINTFCFGSNFYVPLDAAQNPISQTFLLWGGFAVWSLKLSEQALDYKSTVQQFPWITWPSSPIANSTPSCSSPLPGEDSLCRGDPRFRKGVSAALFCSVGCRSCLLPVKMILQLRILRLGLTNRMASCWPDA